MTPFEKKHSFNFFLLTVLLISFYIGGRQGGYNIFDDLVSKDIVGLICFFLILTVGISHGSLDNTKGKRILKLYKLKNISIFYLSYIFFALIIVLVWVFLPSISLMLFLIVASYHFGKEDSFLLNADHKNNLYFFFRGLIIILAPLVFHTQETLEIFKTLLIKDNFLINSIIYLQDFYLLSILMSLSILVCIFFYKHSKELNLYGEILSILGLNYFFDPLFAFTIYFCFLHSVRHSISLSCQLDKKNLKNGFKKFLDKALPLSLITALLFILSLIFLLKYFVLSDALLKVIFIGLASLTFPHILLEYLVEKDGK